MSCCSWLHWRRKVNTSAVSGLQKLLQSNVNIKQRHGMIAPRKLLTVTMTVEQGEPWRTCLYGLFTETWAVLTLLIPQSIWSTYYCCCCCCFCWLIPLVVALVWQPMTSIMQNNHLARVTTLLCVKKLYVSMVYKYPDTWDGMVHKVMEFSLCISMGKTHF